jgi:hypothetical protein
VSKFIKKANARVDNEEMHVSASAQALVNLPQTGGGGHHARMGSSIPKNPNPSLAEDPSALAAKSFVSVFPSPSTSPTDSAVSSTGEDSSSSQEGSAAASASEDTTSLGPEDANAASVLTAQTYTDKGTLIGVPKAGTIFSATV